MLGGSHETRGMISDKTKAALFRYGVAIDLVVIATGLALLAGAQPLTLLAVFFVTIVLVAWLAGWKAGLASTALSVVALVVTIDPSILGKVHLIAFAIAGAAVSGAASLVRPRLETILAEAAVTAPTEAVPPSRWMAQLATLAAYVGLPALALLVYANLSDILIRNFGIPSLLQPFIAALAIPIIARREVFRPGTVTLRPLTFLLAGYAALLFASSVWARETYYADERVTEVVKGFLIYVIVGSLAFSWKPLRRALAALVITAAIIGTLTILQSATGNDFGEFGGIARVKEGTLYGEVAESRAGGPVGDPNFYAQILLIAISMAVVLGISETRPRPRLAYFGAACICVTALLFTYSRGGMLSLGVMTALLLVSLRIRRSHALAALGAAALVFLLILPTNIGRRLVTVQELLPGYAPIKLDSAVEKRRLVMGAALGMFKDHPIAGVGAGNFTPYYAEYENLVGSAALEYDPLGSKQYPHSLYIEIAAENGLLGLTLFGAAIALALASLYRARRELLRRGDGANAAIVQGIALAIVGFLVSSLFLHGSYQRYLWLVLGFAAAALKLTERGAVEPVLPPVTPATTRQPLLTATEASA
jgi:O-antigen ligase